VVQLPSAIALFLDCDGTIREPDPAKTQEKFLNHIDHVRLIPDVLSTEGCPSHIIDWFDKLLGYSQDGEPFIVLVSNQGGVESGHVSFRMAKHVMEVTADLLYEQVCRPYSGRTVIMREHILTFCAPYSGWLRKPAIGMFGAAEWRLLELGYHLNKTRSMMVGDRPEDEDAAYGACLAFKWAWQFFDRPDPDEEVL